MFWKSFSPAIPARAAVSPRGVAPASVVGQSGTWIKSWKPYYEWE